MKSFSQSSHNISRGILDIVKLLGSVESTLATGVVGAPPTHTPLGRSELLYISSYSVSRKVYIIHCY